MSSSRRLLKIFIYHTSKSYACDEVCDLYRRLRKWGFDPWLDEAKLPPDQNWKAEIRKAALDADVVLVCLSYTSKADEGYLRKEDRFGADIAEIQSGRAVPLIPVRMDDCYVPDHLYAWQWVDLYHDGGIEKLRRSLNQHAQHLAGVKRARTGRTASPNAQGAKILQPTSHLLTSDFRRIPVYRVGGLEFVKVPAGKFIMGSTDADKMARTGERPRHTVEIPYDYWIGRFPVTSEQYNEFLQARAERHPVENWQERRDHPVRRVSWYAARVYCLWLTRQIWREVGDAFFIRLPSEAEWEKAARGPLPSPLGRGAGGEGGGRIYPWGDTWDPAKCNTKESGIGGTTPVGRYSPVGDSPYGCADMAGNVWEWTGSVYKPYPFDSSDDPDLPFVPGADHRVLRGGSFFNRHAAARCTARIGQRYKDWDYGFRVVLSGSEGPPR